MYSDFIIRGTKIVEYIGNGGDVVIPEGVTEIDDTTFTNAVHHYEYDSKRNIPIDKTEVSFDVKDKITSIHVSSTVVEINNAFCDLINLSKVTFADNSKLETIPYMAFRDCKSLRKIVLPESVKSIEKWAFMKCNDVTVVVGSKCKVDSDVFGISSFLSVGAKIEVPYNYEYKNDIDKQLLLPQSSTKFNSVSLSSYDSSVEYYWFIIIAILYCLYLQMDIIFLLFQLEL